MITCAYLLTDWFHVSYVTELLMSKREFVFAAVETLRELIQ